MFNSSSIKRTSPICADCMTSWVVLRHPGDGHLGRFLWSGAADDASCWLKQL